MKQRCSECPQFEEFFSNGKIKIIGKCKVRKPRPIVPANGFCILSQKEVNDRK